jgi:hypothetical protein
MNRFSEPTHWRRHALTLALGAAIFPAAAFAQEAPQSRPAPLPAASASKPDKGVWSLSSGISYSRGDYGDIAATEVVSVPVSLKYRRGNWRFKVSVPWVSITGPGSLLQTPEGRDGSGGSSFVSNDAGGGSGNSGSGNSGSGTSGAGGSGSSGSSSGGSGSSGSGSSGSGGSGSGGSGSGSSGSGGSGSGSGGSGSGTSGSTSGTTGGVVAPAAGLASNRRSGLGDATASLTYSFEFGSGFYADVTGKVKIPTASTVKRLGTGQVDFTASLDLSKDIGPASIYVSGRRKFAGRPTGSTIRSVWGAGGGASIRASRGLTIGADYDWQQSSFAGGGASSEVTGWAYVRLNRELGMTVYAGTGLNSASANFLGGATLTFRF